jgi:hypothetical protein
MSEAAFCQIANALDYPVLRKIVPNLRISPFGEAAARL